MIKCLIIEDEPLAADVLVDYINQVPFLQLVGVCGDALQATEILASKSIDLVFLDIHLPVLKGLDFLRTLSTRPHVILTTAYHEYALQGYEHNVVDYLLKPIEFKRFLQAVNKVNNLKSDNADVLAIHSDKKTVLIPVKDILFIESQKEYIKIQTTTASHISKYALSKIEEELDPKLFIRIHRSFIVSTKKINSYNSQEIEVGGKPIPIGGNYRDSILKRLDEDFKT
jgi:two-component system LytT family response regulator